MIDTCSMLNKNFEQSVEILTPFLKKSGKKLIIPYACYNELKKHSEKEGISIAERAKIVLNYLDFLLEQELIRILGSSEDNPHADNVLQTVFTKFRTKYWLYLITEDKKLRRDILKLNDSESVIGRKIEIVNIDYILNYKKREEELEDVAENIDSHSPQINSEKKKKKRFKVCETITDIPNEIIKIKYTPSKGDIVFTEDNLEITLGESIKEGGEGEVFYTNEKGYVAKIYHKDKLTLRNKFKIEAIIDSEIKINEVCFPTKALYNKEREFVGYLMPLAKGKPLESIFRGRIGMQRHFPNWKRIDLVNLSITIFSVIKKLHKLGILIGDLNGYNILVCSPSEVYFVDTDSYQINNFPCPVGTPEFTPPELQGKEYKDFLRTPYNEYFALAVLLFRIMMLGLNPYSHKGGEGIAANIASGNFSFPFKENSNGKAPEGDWKYIWSHLFFPLKNKIYNTFNKNGDLYAPDKRPSAISWLNTLKQYKSQLEDGTIGNYDRDSESLFPNSYKKIPNEEYGTCIICGKDHITKYLKESICPNCLKQDNIYECKRCGKELKQNNYTKYVLKKPVYPYCRSCDYDIKREKEIQRKNSIYCTMTCNCCGKKFNITNGENEFFETKGWDLPKRCQDCRQQGKRKDYYTQEYTRSSYNKSKPQQNKPSPTKKKDSGWCFLTTVVCEYYNYPDDCYELRTLRHFRDNWLAHQPKGKECIQEYYRIAPKIVENIKNSPRYDKLCVFLMNEYINPCISLINSHKEWECKMVYETMINHLLKIFKV